jgi:hypothetical protein
MNNIDQIDWKELSSNPNAIELLKANQDKINWEKLSANPNAIDLLRSNPDKIHISIYSNPSIFTYDYDQIRLNRVELHQELFEELYHISRVIKYLATHDDLSKFYNL